MERPYEGTQGLEPHQVALVNGFALDHKARTGPRQLHEPKAQPLGCQKDMLFGSRTGVAIRLRLCTGGAVFCWWVGGPPFAW